MRRAALLALVGALCLQTLLAIHLLLPSLSADAPVAKPQPQDPDLAFAEQALRKAGAATDGPGIVAFIRSRTLTGEQRKALADKVRALGSPEFAQREKAMRELVALGRAALPYLRPAMNDADLETSRRARRCIELIQRNPNPSLMTLAALVVKARRPPEAVPVLLDYLPSVEEETLEETWLDTLRAIGWKKDQPEPALLAALTDKRPPVRAAAAHVLGRGPVAAVRNRVTALLADADARVRFEAASSLASFGHKKAVEELITLLTDGPFPLACRSEYLLFHLADGSRVEPALDKDDATLRRQCRLAWQAWWGKQAERVNWDRLQRVEPLRGLTLVGELIDQGGQVWEWGQAGQPCWSVLAVQGPQDAHQLADGHVLIAEHHANRVTERDHTGKILWEHATDINPITCHRLPNGNTLIVTYEELYEVTREQKKVFSHRDRRDFRDALQLPDGHILYVTSEGTLVERDAQCANLVRSIQPAEFAAGAKYRARVERLVNGRYLLTLGGSNRVIEIDNAGKIRWQCTVNTPMSATRLPNGQTLIASYEDRCVIEVDRAGKEVNRQVLQGRPLVVRRY